MIKSEVMTDRISVEVDGTTLQLANEFRAICQSMFDNNPEIFTMVMADMFSDDEDEEEEKDSSLDDLFEDAMKQLEELSIRKGGDKNNAKS